MKRWIVLSFHDEDVASAFGDVYLSDGPRGEDQG